MTHGGMSYQGFYEAVAQVSNEKRVTVPWLVGGYRLGMKVPTQSGDYVINHEIRIQ